MGVKKYMKLWERIDFRNKINNLYAIYIKCNKPFEIAGFIVIWLFEYFTGCIWTGDKRTMGSIAYAIKNQYVSIGKELNGLIDNIAGIRHILVHEPYCKFNDELVSDIIKYNKMEIIKSFCSVFEEDSAKFEVIYTDVMKTLGLMHSLEQEQKQEQEDKASSLYNSESLSLDTHYY